MSKAAGIVVIVAEHRRERLLAEIGNSEIIAEAVPEFRHSSNTSMVAIICFEDGKITHLAKARRGVRAATGLSRLNLTQITELPTALDTSTVIDAVPGSLRRYAVDRFANGGLLPPASFVAVVDAIRSLSSASRRLLDRFSAARRRDIANLNFGVKRALAFQKEAVATAMELANIDREELQQWNPPQESLTTESFLDGLQSARVREDPMVIHDMMNVPGFEQIRTLPYGAAVFVNNDVRLTVVLANRLRLEEQFGADLVYFNEKFKSFIIVQYKAMEKDGSNEAIFRLPNASLAREIERMDATLVALRACAPNTERHGFRLTENPFFLKFCPRMIFHPDGKALTPGMYIPLEYWRFLQNDTTLTGASGGRQISYKNVSRYFDNTGFIGLVTSAWVGTTVSQSHVLQDVIREIISSGRTVAIAVKTTTDGDPMVVPQSLS